MYVRVHVLFLQVVSWLGLAAGVCQGEKKTAEVKSEAYY